MAGGNGHGSAPIDPELLEDLDAFVPKVVGHLKVDGTTYALPHYRDLYVEDVLTFITIWNEEGGGAAESFDRAWRRLKVLVPELPDAAKKKLTFNAIDRLLTKATRVDGPPVPGEAAASASASPSPSTDGSIPATASAQ